MFPLQKRINRLIHYGLITMFALATPISPAHGAISPFSQGEVITYDIVKFKVKIGEATLVFEGPINLDGRNVLSVIFTARGFKFFDQEKIYLDPDTFFPVQIQRDLNIFGNKEQITEFYAPNSGEVRIVKTAKGKTSEQVIEGEGQFDNIYGFIYRYRKSGNFDKGEQIQMHLPTMDVQLGLVKQTTVKASGQKFDVHYLRSKPKKYKLWFDSSAKRIPLKIKGALGFGDISMIFKTHND